MNFAAGSANRLFLLKGRAWDEPAPADNEEQPASETVLVYEGTKLAQHLGCSHHLHAVRHVAQTDRLYASGLNGLDILDPNAGVWLHSIQPGYPDHGVSVPDVAHGRIYMMNARGLVMALQHPAA